MNGGEIILVITSCLPLKMRKEHLRAAESSAPVRGMGACTAERGSWLGMGLGWAALVSPSPKQTSELYPGIYVDSD